jgi:hypothetical protein
LITDIGKTEVPYISSFLANDGGPITSGENDPDIKQLLKAITDNNFVLTDSGLTNSIAGFTKNYTYSLKDNETRLNIVKGSAVSMSSPYYTYSLKDGKINTASLAKYTLGASKPNPFIGEYEIFSSGTNWTKEEYLVNSEKHTGCFYRIEKAGSTLVSSGLQDLYSVVTGLSKNNCTYTGLMVEKTSSGYYNLSPLAYDSDTAKETTLEVIATVSSIGEADVGYLA